MRIVWHSGAPWAPTGYGQQTATFAHRIRDLGHDVALSAWWGLNGAMLPGVWDGMNVYPADQRWGNVLLPHIAKHHKADLVIALMDAWVLEPQVMKPLPLAVWCPVDHAPCPPKVAEFFRRSGARPIAMSRFGEQMLKNEGLDPLYVPHGIDTNVFQPGDRDQWRTDVGMADKFVVGVVANNSGGMSPTSGPPRKAFPQMVMAFALFQKNHPDAHLYLHTELTGRPGIENGLNLPDLMDTFEVPESSVSVTDQAMLEFGVAPESMARLYNSFDVLLNPSYGEGFGIPIVEAQACGTPAIVSDWTAMSELAGPGWKLAGGEPLYDPQHGAFYTTPLVEQIADALEDAYVTAKDKREAARAFALQYDADRVLTDHWVPTLEALSKPREVPPLNREMRRKAAKAKVAA